MKITHAEVILTKVPVRRPHKMAIGTTLFQECAFLKLFTDDGLVGWGEAPHMVGYSGAGETQSSVALQLRERLVPAVLGKDPMQIEARQLDLERALPWNPRAKSAINIALYDLVGKALNTPVYNLLGGLVRDRIPLSWSIGIMPFDVGQEEARVMVEEKGFTILKVKVGARENPMDDAEMVRRVRQAVGDKVRIRADANQGYDVPTAVRVVRAMEGANLEFIEQPVGRYDLDGLAEVRRAVSCYVMADESANSPLDVLELARKRAVDLISIYINNGGGISAAKKMAIVAEPANIGCYIGGALEGPIAGRACLHFGASTPNVTFGCETGGQFLLQEDLSTEPIPFENGCLLVPHRPGLGGELDPDKVRRFEVGHFEILPT
jgi:muconate/chloromuconate cycloisomerase